MPAAGRPARRGRAGPFRGCLVALLCAALAAAGAAGAASPACSAVEELLLPALRKDMMPWAVRKVGEDVMGELLSRLKEDTDKATSAIERQSYGKRSYYEGVHGGWKAIFDPSLWVLVVIKDGVVYLGRAEVHSAGPDSEALRISGYGNRNVQFPLGLNHQTMVAAQAVQEAAQA